MSIFQKMLSHKKDKPVNSSSTSEVNEADKRYAERIKVCEKCIFFSYTNTAHGPKVWCSQPLFGCGCKLNTRIHAEQNTCPLKKWNR